MRSHAVDSRFIVGADFEVDARAAFIEDDEIRIATISFRQPFDFPARKTGDEAEHLGRDVKVPQDEGYVDALAAGINHFLFGAVDITGRKGLHVDDIV